jgi:peptidyl-prolyl cis-trans isomerase C
MIRGLVPLAVAALLVCIDAAAAPEAGLRDASSPSSSPAERARRAAVVARVADRTVSAGELEDRLAAVPSFQRAAFGATPSEVKKNFLEKVVLPEVWLEVAGQERASGAKASVAVAHRLARVRANATLRAIRQRVPSPDRIDADEVKLYYEQHKAQYDAPEKVAVWRILVATKDEAEQVIAAAKKDLTVANFTALARDKSLDKATNLRAGNLGFLGDDGVSNEAGLRVEPAIVRAAKTVKDGELVGAPVVEGAHGFAVVWRRGTVHAVKRTLAEADEEIRAILARRIADEMTENLVTELKQRWLGPVDTELVRTVELPSFLDVVPKK